jgi:hypothetical protein
MGVLSPDLRGRVGPSVSDLRWAFPEADVQCRPISAASYSDPIRAPFSATERFISSTTNTSATMTTASTQNTSK